MAFDGVHESSIFEISMKFEKMFSEILGSFKILKVTSHVLSRVECLAFGDVGVILEDDYFIDFKDGRNTSHFADKVCPELGSLGQLQYRIWQGNS